MVLKNTLSEGMLHIDDFMRLYDEAPFGLEDKADWVKGSRIPDVMFYAQARFDNYTTTVPNWRDKPFILVPDLVVEVVSPNDRFTDINRKVVQYIEDGVKIVWVIDPQARNALLHDAQSTQLASENSMLTANALLPDFSTRLSDLLPQE